MHFQLLSIISVGKRLAAACIGMHRYRYVRGGPDLRMAHL